MKDNIYLVTLSNGKKQPMLLVFINNNQMVLGFRTVKYKPYIINTIMVKKTTKLHHDIGILYTKMYSIPYRCVGKMIGIVDKDTRKDVFDRHKKENPRDQVYSYRDIPLTDEIYKKINIINKKITLCKINNQDETELIKMKAELVKKLEYEYKEPPTRRNKYHSFDGYREAVNKNGIWVYGTRFNK